MINYSGEVRCPYPGDPPHGRIAPLKFWYKPGDNIQVTCSPGYVIPFEPVKKPTCQENGIWSGLPPPCRSYKDVWCVQNSSFVESDQVRANKRWRTNNFFDKKTRHREIESRSMNFTCFYGKRYFAFTSIMVSVHEIKDGQRSQIRDKIIDIKCL